MSYDQNGKPVSTHQNRLLRYRIRWDSDLVSSPDAYESDDDQLTTLDDPNWNWNEIDTYDEWEFEPEYETTGDENECFEVPFAGSPEGDAFQIDRSPLSAEHRGSDLMTGEQEQVVEREINAASAAELQRDKGVAEAVVENEAEQIENDWDGDWDDLDSPDRQPYRSPVEEAVQTMLERIPGDSDDHERLSKCCMIAVQTFEQDFDDDRVYESISKYALLKPFSKKLGREDIEQLVLKARRQLEIYEAAAAIGMLSPRELKAIAAQRNDLLEGIVPAGMVGTISGLKNTLKTMIGLDLELSLATGADFLGYWPVKKAINTSIFVAEDSERRIDDAIDRICLSKGIDPRVLPGRFYSSVIPPRLDNDTWRTKTRRFIEAAKIESATIEGGYLGLGGADQRSLQAMGYALAPIKQLSDDTGCAIKLSVHHKRASGSAFPCLQDIAGVGFAELARYSLLLNTRRSWDVVTGQHRLRLVISTKQTEGRYYLDVREGHVDDANGRIWEPIVSVPAAAAAAAEGQREPDCREPQSNVRFDKYKLEVLKALAQHPDGLSKSAMCGKGKVPEARRREVVDALLAGSHIEQCEITISNQKTGRPGYRLSQRS